MQALQQELWSLAGPRVQTHVGDLAWWVHRPPAEGDVLSTYALEGDRVDGYEAGEKAFRYYVRELDELQEPELPEGFALRTVEPEDFLERVAVHRAAWAPSRVTPEIYRRVTKTRPYRADLDCVAEAPDGTFAAYVLCWYDDANGVGELEPVGAHPELRKIRS